MIETQLAQLAAFIPANESGRITGQLEHSVKNVKAITMRGGKSTRDPPYPNPAGTRSSSSQEALPNNTAETEEVAQPKGIVPQEYCDTRLLPFPQRYRKPSVDEQFARFVEVIQNIHIHVPLLDAMQVPTYALYLKDILNNKRPLPTTEVVKLTEECNNAILYKIPKNKKDSRCPTITCSSGYRNSTRPSTTLELASALCPKKSSTSFNFTVLAPTPMRRELANSSVRYSAGIAEDVPVKIRDFFIPVDFVVLEMESDKETPLILGCLFHSTAGANIDVGTGSIHFRINRRNRSSSFNQGLSNAPW
jgi:hypothetical protein